MEVTIEDFEARFLQKRKSRAKLCFLVMALLGTVVDFLFQSWIETCINNHFFK